jgi:hypothetical protein
MRLNGRRTVVIKLSSGVGERFVEGIGFARRGLRRFRKFARFQNRPAIHALDILGFVVFGDQPRVFVFAGGNFRHKANPAPFDAAANHTMPLFIYGGWTSSSRCDWL